jgi:hypothetical protein
VASEMDPDVLVAEGDLAESEPAESRLPATGDDAPIQDEPPASDDVTVPDGALDVANEADVAEQLIPVPLDEDDYR